jgi:hypothetical protein
MVPSTEFHIWTMVQTAQAFKAFDDAWAEIAHHFDGHAEDARARLAHAVLIVTREDSDDPEQLKNDALQVMALAYRDKLKTDNA